MTGQVIPNPYYDEMLKGFVNTYVKPITNWTGAFSPSFHFGCNEQDASTEQHVLDTVGSYGSQINRIMDVVSLLVPLLKDKTLSDSDRRTIADFEELATKADEASSTFRNKRPRDMTLDEVDEFVERIQKLEKVDPARYHKAITKVRTATAAAKR